MPLEKGTLKISGIRVRIFNTVFEHLIDEKGFSMDYVKDHGEPEIDKEKLCDMKNIEILE